MTSCGTPLLIEVVGVKSQHMGQWSHGAICGVYYTSGGFASTPKDCAALPFRVEKGKTMKGLFRNVSWNLTFSILSPMGRRRQSGLGRSPYNPEKIPYSSEGVNSFLHKG